ncbi:MAG: cation diffusion facilitator family transporter [Sphingomicrobium sp.]|nr:cation diffusion facilitator family transporter [Sphingomonadales bacterium]
MSGFHSHGHHHHGHHQGHLDHGERSSLSTRAAIASVSCAIVLLGLKAWGAYRTGSMAMLGSLADTGLDLFASLVILLGVRVAALPADRDHRFGHGKAEALVALGQVFVIGLSAIAIAIRSVERLAEGAATSNAELGIGVSLAAILITLGLTVYQAHVVKLTASVAIATDKLHYQSDMLLNGTVIVALALEQFVHVHGADAVFGLILAAWLGWGAYRSSSQSLSQLMDEEWPESDRTEFLKTAGEYSELAGLHDLRTRSSGTHRFVQFHVWVPGEWTVREAHDRMDPVEEALQRRFPNTEILMHLDPEGHTDRETMLPSHLTEKP